MSLTPFQHDPSLSLTALYHYSRSVHNACHHRSLPAPPRSALPAPHTRPAALQPGPSFPLLCPLTSYHPQPAVHSRTLLSPPRLLSPIRLHDPPYLALVCPARLRPYSLPHISPHRALNHPHHVVHPTRGAHLLGTFLVLPGAVVMHSASTVLSMPLGVHPYSINSLGSRLLRCRVPPTAISQTFPSCLSTRILLHSQIPSPLLDLCVAEKHLCARILSGVAMSLPLASHSLGNTLGRPIPFRIVQRHPRLVSHSIPAMSLSTISCPSSHAASIPALRSEPSPSLSNIHSLILSAYNQTLTSTRRS